MGEQPQDERRDDARIVRRVLLGDRDAFRLLVERHQSRVYRCIRRIVRDRDEAEDVAQEAFVKAYTHLAGYDARWSFATWLTTIATRTALNAARQRSNAVARAVSAEALPPTAEAPSPDASPRRQAAEGEWAERLRAEVEALSETMRVAFGLRYEDDLSIREIAEATRASESAVKVTLHRARKILRERLRAFGDLARDGSL
jgi:RNA polymerase sigma-70 factor (ECF subfamily)